MSDANRNPIYTLGMSAGLVYNSETLISQELTGDVRVNISLNYAAGNIINMHESKTFEEGGGDPDLVAEFVAVARDVLDGGAVRDYLVSVLKKELL